MEPQNAAAFFQVDLLPENMLDKLEAEEPIDLDIFRTISAMMDLAMSTLPLEESAVNDFAVHYSATPVIATYLLSVECPCLAKQLVDGSFQHYNSLTSGE